MGRDLFFFFGLLSAPCNLRGASFAQAQKLAPFSVDFIPHLGVGLGAFAAHAPVVLASATSNFLHFLDNRYRTTAANIVAMETR